VAEAPSSAAPEENGEAGGVAGGVAGTTASPGVVAAPGPSPAELRALLDRYLQQVLRPRILSRLVFPPEAERLGVEGKVLLRLRIGGGGQLLAANVAGACPHEILCEDALRTLRAASPLPPLPPALGPQVDCTFPVTYQLE
jgi:protein TonB